MLAGLRRRICHTDTNLQFLEQRDSRLLALGTGKADPPITPSEELAMLKVSLRRTLPLRVEKIHTWPVSSLSINEVLLLLNISLRFKEEGQPQIALSIAQYVLECLNHMNLGNVCCNEELNTLACLNVLRYLGDCGRYDESNHLAWVCVSQESQRNRIVQTAKILYNIAWNLEHQHDISQQHLSYSFQLAYAAALLEADQVGQKHIQKHYLELFGKELQLI